jgi:hypothetical protein
MSPAPLSHQSAARVARTASRPLVVLTVNPCAAATPDQPSRAIAASQGWNRSGGKGLVVI